MTWSEGLAIAAGLAIGYWFVSVFVPHARRTAGEDGDACTATLDPGADAWHEVLGLAPDADRPAIEAAYRRRLAQYHPDRLGTMAPELRDLAERQMMALDVAYDRALMQLHDRGR